MGSVASIPAGFRLQSVLYYGAGPNAATMAWGDALLRRYGPGFSGPLWSLVYTGVLLPIFDDVRHAVEATS
jgi:hypothetical protein